MVNNYNFILFILILIIPVEVQTITLVYNMKIRRVFNLAVFNKEKKSVFVATSVPIVYKRDRHIILENPASVHLDPSIQRPLVATQGERVDNPRTTNIKDHRLVAGSLFNIRYAWHQTWWGEITTGLETEWLKTEGTSNFKTSRTGFDDVVFSGGYNIFLNPKAQLVFYAIGGVPTRQKVTLLERQDPLVGSRFFGLGFGSELSYSFIQTLQQSVIGIIQTRFLHFFNRTWFPILPQNAKIQPGNVTDLLLATDYRKHRTLFEIGYNPTFFTNQAVKLKTETIKSDGFVRQSVYARIVHLCKQSSFINAPIAIGGGANIARAKKFNTRIYTWWLNMSIIF